MPESVEIQGGPRRCAGTNADGSECKTPEHLLQLDPEGGEELWCFAHAPWLEQERALSSRKGGLRSAAKARRFSYLAPDELPELHTPEDAREFAKLIARSTATGRLSSAAAGVALKALEAFLRSYEAAELATRLAEVERRLARATEERGAQRDRDHPPTYMTRTP